MTTHADNATSDPISTPSPQGEKKPRGRGGRPKSSVLRSKNLVVRLTDDEYDMIGRLAGTKVVSSYAREVLLDPQARFSITTPIAMQQWTELAPVVSNLNQLALHANEGRQVSSDLAPLLEALSAKVDDIRLMLLGAYREPIEVNGSVLTAMMSTED